MPLYEYACACGHRFEALVRSDGETSCPKCSGQKLERLLSVFAVNAQPTRDSAPQGCGSCGDPRGPGACRMN